MTQEEITSGNKLIAEWMEAKPTYLEEVGELILENNLVSGMYRPYPAVELFSDAFCKENEFVKYELELSCGRCSNCNGVECSGYVLNKMPIELFNQYKNIPETFGQAVYPDYHSSWDWLMPCWKKFIKLEGMPMPLFEIHCRYISEWIVRGNIEEAHRCLVDAIKWHSHQSRESSR